MAVTRQLIFGIDPEVKIANTYSYLDIPDGNDDTKAITCCFVPVAKGAGVSLMQETIFIGTNSSVGATLQSFKDSLAMDGDDAIVGEFVTARLDPDNRADSRQFRDSTKKRYRWLNSNGPLLVDYGGSLYWAKDIDPVTSPFLTWTQFNYDSGDTSFYFESGLANWIHVRGYHDAPSSNVVHLAGFAIEYDTINSGERRAA